MTPDLPTIGRALYGARWQTDLAEALGVSDRTVRRWVAGQSVPDGVRAEIRTLARTRMAEIEALLRVAV